MPFLDVDVARGRFDHYCLNCHLTQRGLRLAHDLRTLQVGEDHHVVYVCGACRATETFFDRGEEHEIEGYEFTVPTGTHTGTATHPTSPLHAEQTRFIRAAKRHLGAPLHPGQTGRIDQETLRQRDLQNHHDVMNDGGKDGQVAIEGDQKQQQAPRKRRKPQQRVGARDPKAAIPTSHRDTGDGGVHPDPHDPPQGQS